jgi:hypothetical protein
MEADGSKVSTDASGTHTSLSFSDIAGVVLTNEIATQSENSPIESGDTNSRAESVANEGKVRRD